MSVPRVNTYPWKFAMSYTAKGLSHIYILHETGDAGAHRVVYMDGRGHPADPVPTWWGHSIGWFEDDTLVIDTVGYNDRFWFDSRGTPHTDQLHTIERFTRINFGTLVNEFTTRRSGSVFASCLFELHGDAYTAGPRPDGVHLPRGQPVRHCRRLFTRAARQVTTVNKSALLLVLVGVAGSGCFCGAAGSGAGAGDVHPASHPDGRGQRCAQACTAALPDGRVDLTGPWVGGGPIGDIEREGGLKRRNLAAAAVGEEAARFAQAGRRAIRTLPADERAAPEHLSVEVRDELHHAGTHTHLRAARAWRRGRASRRVHGWPGPPRRNRCPPGGDIRLAGSKAIRSSSTLSDTTIEFWFDRRGTPHTEQLHTIERWTRVNYGTIVNEFTIDDPGAFSRPFELHFNGGARTARHRSHGIHLQRGQPVRDRGRFYAGTVGEVIHRKPVPIAGGYADPLAGP